MLSLSDIFFLLCVLTVICAGVYQIAMIARGYTLGAKKHLPQTFWKRPQKAVAKT